MAREVPSTNLQVAEAVEAEAQLEVVTAVLEVMLLTLVVAALSTLEETVQQAEQTSEAAVAVVVPVEEFLAQGRHLLATAAPVEQEEF
jgi:hypothetical protein